jgi:phospholipid-binding lipoprotein MlaA
MPLLYFGTTNTVADVAKPPISMSAGNRYDALVRLVQAEGETQPEEAEKAEEDEDDEEFPDDDEFPGDEKPVIISDPLEPINRGFFYFNDKLYFWLLRPLAIGYKAVAPEPVRASFNNFFRNLEFPVRFFSCLLQGKQFEAGEEMRRFSINTFMGLGGFFDVASRADIKKYDEDLGQVLGVWGMGPGFYINWPLLGPSNVRDTIGLIGDRFLYPISYIFDPTGWTLGLNALDILNLTSLRLGDYEDLKEAAFDPYIAMRDAYYQNRLSKIKE